MLERREALAKLMTEEQGKPIRMARNEVGYAADFLLWFAEEAKRVYGETIPSARADQRFLVLRQPVGVVARDHAVELPGVDAHPEDRAGARRRLHDRAQAGGADAAAARSRRSRCFEEVGLPEGVVNLSPPPTPRPSATSCVTAPDGAQDHLHRLHRGRQAHRAAGRGGREAGEHGARRPRAVHRVRRRRPGARGEGRGGGEVPQHRSGVHLPEPHARAARHRRASSSPPWSSASTS